MCPVRNVTYVSGRSPPQIQQLHAAFLEATAFDFRCESCETLVGRMKPRPISSHHLRRYFTSSRSCSAYWSVRSLCACPIQIFSMCLANCYFAHFPQDPKLNVTLLHCAQNLPQDQFARDTANLASSTFTFARTASSTANITSAPPHNL